MQLGCAGAGAVFGFCLGLFEVVLTVWAHLYEIHFARLTKAACSLGRWCRCRFAVLAFLLFGFYADAISPRHLKAMHF